MRRWIQAPVVTMCGGCGRMIPKGAALLQMVFGPQKPDGVPMPGAERPKDWTQTKSRCEHCADEPAPAEVTPQPQRILRPDFQTVGVLARDWKLNQSGDK